MGQAEDRFWRTIVKVVTLRKDSVVLDLPTFDPHNHIEINRSDIPDIFPELREEMYIRVYANTGAMREENLRFKDWEIPSLQHKEFK